MSRANSEWALYSKYCDTKEKGLRKEALKILNQFIEDINKKPFSKRVEFTNWVEERRFYDHEVIDLIPHPLQKKVIEPTLKEWSDKEPENPVPFRWINTKESLIKAIDLDKTEQIARYRLFHKIIGWIDYNQHELEYYSYLGNPKQDLELLKLVREKIQGINIYDPKSIFDVLEARIKICEVFIEFEKSDAFGKGKFIGYIQKSAPEFDVRKYL